MLLPTASSRERIGVHELRSTKHEVRKLVITVHVAHKVGGWSWSRAVRWKVKLQIAWEFFNPLLQLRDNPCELWIIPPVFLPLDLGIYIAHGADIANHARQVCELSRGLVIGCFNARRRSWHAEVDGIGVNTHIASPWPKSAHTRTICKIRPENYLADRRSSSRRRICSAISSS